MSRALDSILGPGSGANGDDGSMISATVSLTPVDGAVLAEVQRTDVVSGAISVELVHLDAERGRRAAVMLGPDMGGTESRIAQALMEGGGPDVFNLGTGLMTLKDAFEPFVGAVNGLGLSGIDTLSRGEDWCAVLGRSAQGDVALHVLEGGDVWASQQVPLDDLNLTGWRRLNDVQIVGDRLYVAVADPVSGFDVLVSALGSEDRAFTSVMTSGARRFALNAAVAGFLPCETGLLVGTAALAGPKRPVGDWGPELLLVTPDENWDLIAGQPRFAPDGLVLPASTEMPGMGHPHNAAIRTMARNGARVVIAVQDHAGPSEEDRREVRPDLSEYSGAVRLYLSDDLDAWRELPHQMDHEIGSVTCMCLTDTHVIIGHEGVGGDVMPVRFVPLG